MVCDTETFIDNANNLSFLDEYNVVVTGTVLAELEKHKISRDRDLAYRARQVVRHIKDNEDKVTIDINTYDVEGMGESFNSDLWDDRILACCYYGNHGLITGDFLLQIKARGLGIECISLEDKVPQDNEFDPNYKGYIEVEMTQEELQEVYVNLGSNKWGLQENQYLIVEDCLLDDEIDALCWRDNALHAVESSGFRTNQFGNFKPRDFYQKSAVDSIINNEVTMITGKAGTGKSLIALETSWHLIERGKYDRLIVFSNPTTAKHAEDLGFYTGSMVEKLLQSSIGNMLISKFGDIYEVEREIDSGRLTILPFSDIRGYDTTSEKKTIVLFAEAQNTNRDLMKMGLERIGDNTKVIIDGDPTTQVDNNSFRLSNGMTRASEVFRGSDLYGEIQLKYIYRSPVARLASKM